MNGSTRIAAFRDDGRHRSMLLAAIAVASIMLWQTTIGSSVLYPFTILSTWFHEMGHGLAAVLAGRGFDQLVIFGDGSGYAITTRPGDGSRLIDAFVSASGPMGPAVAGSALILSSRTGRATNAALTALGLALIVSTIVWVRSTAGWLVLPAAGLSVLGLSLYAGDAIKRFAIQLLGVQACISVWRQFDYLFSAGGSIGGRTARSDTSAIADALLLPYWFWGGTISVAIVALLWFSISRSMRR